MLYLAGAAPCDAVCPPDCYLRRIAPMYHPAYHERAQCVPGERSRTRRGPTANTVLLTLPWPGVRLGGGGGGRIWMGLRRLV